MREFRSYHIVLLLIMMIGVGFIVYLAIIEPQSLYQFSQVLYPVVLMPAAQLLRIYTGHRRLALVLDIFALVSLVEFFVYMLLPFGMLPWH